MGAHTVRPRLVNSPNYRLVSAQPITIVVVPDLAVVTGTLLSSTLVLTKSFPCLPISLGP